MCRVLLVSRSGYYDWRGSHYTSERHIRELKSAGVTVSMSGTGNCDGNAIAESFFATLKTEELYHRGFATRVDAPTAIFDYIETFYNSRRLHTTPDYRGPIRFEAPHKQKRAARLR